MKTLLLIFYVALNSLNPTALAVTTSLELSVIEIHWSSTDASVQEYRLYRATAGEAWSLLQVIYGDENSFVDWNVKPQNTYQYCLQAKYMDGRLSTYTTPVRVVLK